MTDSQEFKTNQRWTDADSLKASPSGDAGEKRRLLRLLAGVIVFSFLLRLLVALPGLEEPHRRFFRNDSPSYVDPALALLATGAYQMGLEDPEPATVRAPRYPAILALLFAISGKSFVFPVIASCLISALTVWPVFRTTQYLGGPFTGLTAALLLGLNLTAIAAARRYLSDTLFMFVGTWQLLWFWRFYRFGRLVHLSFSVVCARISALIRTVDFFWLVLSLLLILIDRRWSLKRRLIVTAGCVVVFAAVVVPWMARNHSIGAGFVVHTNIGNTLYYNNCIQLVSIATGESAEKLCQEWRARTKAEFSAHPDTYSSVKSRNDYLVAQAWNQIQAYSWLYLYLHIRPLILLPDAPTLLEILGLTQTGRGTLDVLNSEGLVPAIRHYFGDNW